MPPEIPPAHPAAIPPYAPAPGVRRRGSWAMLPTASLAMIFSLFSSRWVSVEIAVEGMAITGAFAAVLVPLVWSGVGPWANGARRAAPAFERALIEECHALGIALREVWLCPAPPLSPRWSPAMRAGRRLLLWTRVCEMTPREIAGGVALSGSRVRGWPLGLIAGGAALGAAIFGFRSDAPADIPPWILPLCLGIVAAVAAYDVIGVSTARRRAAAAGAPERAAAIVRGMLRLGRAQARWLATGLYGSGLPVAFPNRGENAWERALERAHDVASSARLDSNIVSQTALGLITSERLEPRPRIV